MMDADEGGVVGKYGNQDLRYKQNPHWVETVTDRRSQKTAEHGTQTGQDNALGALHQTDFAFQPETFRTCAYITYHNGADE